LTGTTFDHYSPSGDNVFFKKPDMHLSCTSHRITGFSLSWDDSGFPPNTWFNLLALAGKYGLAETLIQNRFTLWKGDEGQ
jgi:hypothetical protein